MSGEQGIQVENNINQRAEELVGFLNKIPRLQNRCSAKDIADLLDQRNTNSWVADHRAIINWETEEKRVSLIILKTGIVKGAPFAALDCKDKKQGEEAVPKLGITSEIKDLYVMRDGKSTFLSLKFREKDLNWMVIIDPRTASIHVSTVSFWCSF